MKPAVWAIVLNWNLPDDTNECVASLLKSDYPNLTVLVVDNGSEPANVAKLTVEEQGAKLLRNERNLGFAEGCNVGAAHALANGADYVFLINNDTFIDPGMVSELVSVATSTGAGITGPMIYYADAPERVWFSGVRFWGQLYIVRLGQQLRDPRQRYEAVDFISGCGMLVTRAVWEQVGPLSKAYFMYYEDLDFCVRAKRAGARIVCAPQAAMWHKVSASSGGSESPQKQRYHIQNSLRFYRAHTRGPWLALNIAYRLSHAVLHALKLLMRGQLRLAAITAYIAGIRDARQQG